MDSQDRLSDSETLSPAIKQTKSQIIILFCIWMPFFLLISVTSKEMSLNCLFHRKLYRMNGIINLISWPLFKWSSPSVFPVVWILPLAVGRRPIFFLHLQKSLTNIQLSMRGGLLWRLKFRCFFFKGRISLVLVPQSIDVAALWVILRLSWGWSTGLVSDVCMGWQSGIFIQGIGTSVTVHSSDQVRRCRMQSQGNTAEDAHSRAT